MAVLRTQSAAWIANRADLDETYEALTGFPPIAIWSDAVMVVKVCMAMLSAIAATGKAGVPKEWKPEVLTLTERGVLKMQDQVDTNYPEDSVAAKLKAETKPKPAKKEKAPATPRVKLGRVRATPEGTGTSALQTKSDRYAVYTHIFAAGQDGISMEDLDAATGLKSRGFVQKLIEKNHVEMIPEQDAK